MDAFREAVAEGGAGVVAHDHEQRAIEVRQLGPQPFNEGADAVVGVAKGRQRWRSQMRGVSRGQLPRRMTGRGGDVRREGAGGADQHARDRLQHRTIE